VSAVDRHAVRVLLVQRWTLDASPVEAALVAAGIHAAITRVDFEAALNAALAHEAFDVAIFDPATPAMSVDLVETCLKVNQRDVPIVILAGVDTIGEQVLQIIAPHRN
jgi:DNA-binding NarL/FixJ family response regulator